MPNILPFELWKAQLRSDCQRMHKLLVFDSTGDYVLQLLWKNGIEPTVQAIIADAESVKRIDGINLPRLMGKTKAKI
jgi:hypothetical protein